MAEPIKDNEGVACVPMPVEFVRGLHALLLAFEAIGEGNHPYLMFKGVSRMTGGKGVNELPALLDAVDDCISSLNAGMAEYNIEPLPADAILKAAAEKKALRSKNYKSRSRG